MRSFEYAERAEHFFSQICREEYLHLSGLKDTFETEAIFQEHQELFTCEVVQERLHDRQDRNGRYLAEFAVHNYIEQQIRELTEAVSNAENAAEVTCNGETLPFRSACGQLFKEADLSRRRGLEAAVAKVISEQNDKRAQRIKRQREISQELSFKNYLHLCEDLSGQSLRALCQEMKIFLKETEGIYRKCIKAALDKEGIPLNAATEADLRGTFLMPKCEYSLPPEKLLPAAERTLKGLGIDLAKQPNVHIDLEARDDKHPRPFCCAINVPGEVWVVVSPYGNVADYLAFFHELGHAEHFSHVNPQLPPAYRLMGDKAVCEGFAFTFQSVVGEKHWLSEVVGLGAVPEGLLNASFLFDFVNARRCAAKLCFGIELHSGTGDIKEMGTRYAELLSSGMMIKVSPENYLYDLDDAFYYATYLRAWIFDACVRERLREEAGKDWFFQQKSGRLLQEFWSRGQELTAEELERELLPSTRQVALHQRLYDRLQT